jgi:hypothetical protein
MPAERASSKVSATIEAPVSTSTPTGRPLISALA